jgi:hypothetical protein
MRRDTGMLFLNCTIISIYINSDANPAKIIGEVPLLVTAETML